MEYICIYEKFIVQCFFFLSVEYPVKLEEISKIRNIKNDIGKKIVMPTSTSRKGLILFSSTSIYFIKWVSQSFSVK